MTNGLPRTAPARPAAPALDIGTGTRVDTDFDTSVAHSARRYDYWLGGKDNFPADRASGDAVAAQFPSIRTAAQENRKFLQRAITYLTREAGIRQFLDIGTGLPTATNTHDAAQRFAPDARVVYIDNDPIVVVHARARLTSTPPARTEYLHADLRDPAAILGHPTVRDVLDFDEPIALLLVAVLHFIDDSSDPAGLVRAYLDALSSGSYLVLSHATGDHMPPDTARALTVAATRGSEESFQLRAHDQITRFFDGLELIAPGLVSVVDWRSGDGDDSAARPSAEDVSMWAGVARRP